MKTIFSLESELSKCVLIFGCFLAGFLALTNGWINLSGEGMGVPLDRGRISSAWIRSAGDMGYPLSFTIMLATLSCSFVLCASSLKDAAVFSLFNLFGIGALGLLSQSPSYIYPCTHDSVMVTAWLAACMILESSKWRRILLLLCLGTSLLWIGEVWRGLGGSWCPLRDSEKIYGGLWMACMGWICALSVFCRILQARLGISGEGRHALWSAVVLLAVLSIGVFPKFTAWLVGGGRFGGEELGWLFGVGIPLSAASLNAACALGAGVFRACGRLRKR